MPAHGNHRHVQLATVRLDVPVGLLIGLGAGWCDDEVITAGPARRHQKATEAHDEVKALVELEVPILILPSHAQAVRVVATSEVKCLGHVLRRVVSWREIHVVPTQNMGHQRREYLGGILGIWADAKVAREFVELRSDRGTSRMRNFRALFDKQRKFFFTSLSLRIRFARCCHSSFVMDRIHTIPACSTICLCGLLLTLLGSSFGVNHLFWLAPQDLFR